MIYFSGLVYSPSVIAVHICTYKLYSDSVGCCAGGTSFVFSFILFFIYPFLWFPLVSFCPPPSGWLSGLYLCTCCVLVLCVLQNVMCHEWLDEMQKAGIWIHTLSSIPPCPPTPTPHWERPHCMQVEVFGTWVSSRLILVASSSFSLVCWCGRVETYVSYPCGVKPSDYLLNFIFIKENFCNCRIITRKG